LDLLKQFHDLFSKLFNEKIGYIGNGVCEVERINIVSVWTAGKALNINKSIDLEDEIIKEQYSDSNKNKIVKCLKQANVHIFDECHAVLCNTIKSIFNSIEPEYIFGMSGTPFRFDGTDLAVEGILGNKIVDISASELISKGFLAQPIIKFIAVPPIRGGSYQEIYKKAIVDNVVRNTLIVHHTKELIAKGYVPLVLFRQIKHGEILFDMLKEAGVKCEKLSGEDKLVNRERVKEALKTKEIECCLASSIFEQGIDVPIISALVNCGGLKANVATTQKIGRTIRKYPGKQYAAIIDFYDQSKHLKKHSIRRCEIYLSEPGFKVIKCKEMK
jgi:superfamily II DNA or RNA helicase